MSSRPGMGSIPYADADGTGVTFRVWAPNAASVAVRGDFNGWGQTALAREADGIHWSRDIAAAQPGQQYRYFINGNLWRRDPRARRVTNSNGNSVIYDPNAFDWGGVSQPMPFRNDAVLYQMHAGTYNAEDWIPGTFDKNIERLDHIKNLGANVIQLMPVNEFAADRSWGYNPSDVFAIESAYGGPDALKRFVKAAHERGIAVFADVVHNHYGPSDLALWQFDGWSQNNYGGIYFYNSTDGKPNTWWGDTRPDFSRVQVRAYIRDHIFMFVDEYRIGGFRWDSMFNILYYNDGRNHNQQGEFMVRDINRELSQQRGYVFRISEDHAFDFSVNFESMWDVAFHNHLKWQVTQTSDADRNMNWLRDNLPTNANLSRVVFSEAHDYVGDLNNNVRLPRAIDDDDPQSIFARKRQLLAAAMVFTRPGIPMIFQGQEMNEDWTFSDGTALRWSLTEQNAGIVRAYRDLIHARRNFGRATAGLQGDGINVHQVDDLAKVISFIRWNQGGQTDDVVVVANFGATVRNGYTVEFPSDGSWYNHFNSDAIIYADDFGDVGAPVVNVSGGEGSVDLGSYAVHIYSRQPMVGTGLVTFDPPAPDGCGDITITYATTNGPLQSATGIVARIGRNGWQDMVDTNLSWNGTAWEITHEAPIGTYELNLIFHDGEPEESRTYDNNFGADWRIAIANCADLPALVSISPAQPRGCTPVTITYDRRDGALASATNLNLYIGRNNWLDIQTLSMSPVTDGVWQATYEIPASSWQMNFVFNDGTTWDNNDGDNWQANIIGCVQTLLTGISITNPVSDISVASNISSIVVAGESSSLVGELQWTNASTRQSGTLPAAGAWSIPAVALADGPNLIRVSGASDTVNPNQSLRDAGTNTTYNSGWSDGANGGSGFDEGWRLIPEGTNAGFFMAGPDVANNSLGARAWGLWANSDSTANAIRAFPSTLLVGDAFLVNFDHNWIDGGKGVGIGFQNRFGQDLFEFYFIGGGTNYLLNDRDGERPTGVPWSGDGWDISFALLSPETYAFSFGPHTFTGTLIESSEEAVKQVRFWNFSAGGGSEYNVYIDGLSVSGEPLESITFSSERTVTRGSGGSTTTDGLPNAWWDAYGVPLENRVADGDHDLDGVKNEHEFIAGTDPASGVDYPRVMLTESGDGWLVLAWPGAPGRLHVLESSASLTGGFSIVESNLPSQPPWMSYTSSLPAQPQRFFRVGTYLDPAN
jgi:1,4-alpha-glucan branching enzyme